MHRKILPGHPYPLGATWRDDGVNFSIFSEFATAVDLCLFRTSDAPEEHERIRLPMVTGHVWHGFLPGLKPGQCYGYRVHGPYDPSNGMRFNPNKLLLDPYAKAITGQMDWDAPVFGFKHGDPVLDQSFDEQDDAWGKPRGIVVDDAFDWEGDELLRTPWSETVIYETHVKGFTILHPEVPREIRGTYPGLASQPVINYLTRLGITAVELMPVHSSLSEKHLVDHGLTNYWGYNSINFFAPDSRYASNQSNGNQVTEFKQMVKAFHKAGIEVILDVVYNHTAEGNEFGPTLSLRGIDNQSYYRLVPDKGRYYLDYTGCGNSLNVRSPQVLRLIMDSLRYWVLDMHVDGFRFDLAAALARELHDVDRLAAFFDIIHQDPVLSQVKLIAEPWDVGPGGYQVGNFPVLWTEWNGKYRDTMRRFWRGDPGQVADLARRLTGSSDLYQSDGRNPYASINYITSHDGFTLHDLVSYEHKHNEANQEHNRDGSDHNLSANYGVEGPTSDCSIATLRQRQVRNLLTTLLLSQGVPMLSGGDEIGKTQLGNNNAYCQDNEMNWYRWDLDVAQKELLEFTRQLVALRHRHPNLRRTRFLHGETVGDSTIPDVTWFQLDGNVMTPESWHDASARCLAMRLGGQAIEGIDQTGERIVDETLLVLLNASEAPVEFTLPPDQPRVSWQVLVDTHQISQPHDLVLAGDRVEIAGRTLQVLSTSGDDCRHR
jgi:isoamylase